MQYKSNLRQIGIALYVTLCTLVAGAQDFGLDSRPVNSTCLAFERPDTGASVHLVRQFPALSLLSNITQLAQAPGDPAHWYFATREGLIGRFENRADVSTVETILDLRDRVQIPLDGGLIQMVFHPGFPVDRRIFVNYSRLGTVTEPWDAIISSFEVSADGSRVDPLTEKQLIVRPRNNVHQGGFMAFGTDGRLYLGLGDGGRQGDPTNNAQNDTDLRGKVLRIDVDNVPDGEAYGIPVDNPHAGNPRCIPSGTAQACPEIFAKGFRNPFRGDIDLETGEIWLGDVGWLKHEEIDKVVRGGNYGWALCEGKSIKNTTTACDQPETVPPVLDYQHAGGNCAVIGGFVYRGDAIPGLQGRFLFGDYCSGKISAVKHDSNGAFLEEVLLPGGAASVGRIFTFARDSAGELYIVAGAVNTVIYKLINASPGISPVPPTLSATGCFDAANPRTPALGLIPYDLNSPLWSDGAAKRRWMALPDTATVAVDTDGDFQFPAGTVLAKEFSFGGVPHETRLLVRHQDGVWSGYSYEWRADGSDADLLPAGKVKTLPAGVTWTYPSRGECLRCHTDAAGFSLGPEIGQLNRSLVYPQTGRDANQLETLDHIGLLAGGLPAPVTELPAYAGLDQDHHSVAYRAKSYLHANCSGCHRPGEVTQAPMDFRFSTPTAEMNTCGVEPVFGDLGQNGATILTPGDPERSVVYLRDGSRDPLVQMPPLGTGLTHTAWLSILYEWISQPGVCAAQTDADSDGITDDMDNCPTRANPAQFDADRDGVGDACEVPTGDHIAPTAPGSLTAIDISNNSITLAWTPASDGVGVVGYHVYRDRVSVPLASVDGLTLTFTDTGLAAGSTHRYAVTAYDLAGNESVESPEAVGTTLSSPVMSHRDIGLVSVKGAATLSADMWTVKASGADIGGSADQFYFVYQPMVGDGEILVRLDSLRQTHVIAKAGLMMRSTLDADSPNVMAYVTPTRGAGFSQRQNKGGSTLNKPLLTATKPPEWLRLVRRGTLFDAYVSENGTAWTPWIASVSVPLPETVHVGLAVTSHTNKAKTLARFSGLRINTSH